ncbi:IPT/TIG domain-containing protein [Terrabacter sp. NPDC080008]|uniref:IPT/TIG domain-containing protein n=1 Tax=Terrabacter sp. NPDC080008 TaxID=3155176 RepID=UPI00344D3FC7
MLPGPTRVKTAHHRRPRPSAGAGRALAVLVSVALLVGLPGVTASSTATAATLPAPTSVSLSVVAGPTRGGTAVDLTGTGVGATTKVLFGASVVTRVTRISSTRVRVVTPAHAPGVTNVRVVTPSGTSPVSSRASFAFDPVPTVSALSVRSTTTRGGAAVTITGTALYRVSAVRFGTTAATSITRLSATQLRVTAPAHAAGTVDVRITTPGGTSPATAADRFTYTVPPVLVPPTVTALSVAAGPVAGGTVVTVTGTRLTGATAVTFGATPAARFTVLSASQLRVTAPGHTAGTVSVRVRTASGTSVVGAANTYAYEAVPMLTRVSPPSGSTTGGTTVTLTGTSLGRATAVRFGTATTTRLVRVSATTLRAVTPAGLAGTVDVRVVTPGGTSPVGAAARFSYSAPPAVTALSTTAGPVRGGTPVTITGARLGGASRVSFGTAPATFTVVSATTIRAVAPAHAAGTVSVTVTTPYGTSAAGAASAYAYDPVPAVTSLSPSTGPRTGGTVVTLTGTGLTRATAVRFGTTSVTDLVRVSPTTLRVTAPAHPTGPVDVVVSTPGGTSVPSAASRYAFGRPPAVSGISVTAGPLTGGTVVTVTGTDLAEATSVRFGSALATGVVRVSDTTLRATAPAQAEGTVAVRVTNANGTSPDTAVGRYTYVGVPAVTALSAPAGPLGGTVVTLTGTRLALATTVTFGGVPASALLRLSDTTLRVTAPAHAVGTVDVRVSTPGGVSPVTAAGRFAYQPVPTLTAVSPALAPTKGGGVVTLSGTGYDRVSSVTFGGVPASTVTPLSATQLRVTLPPHAEGDVDVRVTTPGGTSPVVPAGRFTFQDAPVVASVTPATGPLRGGTVVTLRGTSFTSVSAVRIGGVAATTFTRVSATQLTAVVPPRAATGAVSVQVTTRAGTATRASGFTYVAGASLLPGQTLSPGTALRAPAGGYTATMQADGNLVVATSSGARRWASATTGAGNRLVVRPDGNLAVLRVNGTVAWSSGTNGWTGAQATLTDGGLLQARQGSSTVWDHRGVRYDRMLAGQVLRPGESIVSSNSAWSLVMRTDGNLVLTTAQGVRRWATFTTGAGNTAAMQTDGSFVVRSAGGVVRWSTRTSGSGAVVRVLGTSNVAVYRGSTVTWAITGGPAPAGWACYSRATQDCISRFGYYGQRAWGYPVDAWGNNCTNFSAYRLSRDGVPNPGNLGNAATWDDYARAKGFAVDQRPRVGDIAQWNSNHVAYVDWVSSDGNTVAISESGYGGYVLGKTYTSMSGRRILTRGSYSWPSNFIHFR